MNSENIRKLAAILFADVIGYTSLMQKDEVMASTILRHFQKQLQEKVSAHQGKVVNLYGDGALCTFLIPLDAVRCAMELQTSFQTDPVVPVRVGIHSGTVTYEGEKVFGDSINIASRIESMGIEGGILLSKRVRDEVKNNPGLELKSLGSFDFKNVDEPIELFALANEGFRVPRREVMQGKLAKSHRSSHIKLLLGLIIGLIAVAGVWIGLTERSNVNIPDEKSIAVLAFEDLSQNQDQEFFSDGVAEEILNALSKLEGLKVAGRISSFSFKNKTDVSISEIGQELNVTTILNGSIRKHENKIRVTANLINALDGFQIWSETYDEELKDIFQIQEKIAKNIVQKFQLTHSIRSKQSLFSRQTSNLEAYEKYLEGKFYSNKSADGLEDARLAYEEAIRLDTNYVQAINGLAETYFSMGFYNLAPKPEFYEKSRKTLMRAIELDPFNADAFNQLGFLNFAGDYDWDAAMTNFAKANILSHQANNSLLPYFSAVMHPTAKNQERAIRSFETDVKRDPLSIEALLDMNRIWLDAGDYEPVIRNSEKIFRLAPDQRSALRHVGEAYMFSGRPELSLPYFEKAITNNNYTFYNYITNLVLLGRQEEANAKYEEKKDELDVFAKALCSIALGDFDNAFDYLDQAYEMKHPLLVFFKVHRHYEPVRSDPRYKVFESKMNFPKELLN